jgi:hypothetical protein
MKLKPRHSTLLAAWLGASLLAAAQAAPPGLDIDHHSGVIRAIEPSRQTIQIDDHALQWETDRLRVVQEITGKPLPLSQLRRGMRVRYALGAVDGRAAARIVAVYVLERP